MLSEGRKPPAAACARARRIASLDQFRGYAIFGMIMVHYLGKSASSPDTLRHHKDGMSYALTIAPRRVIPSCPRHGFCGELHDRISYEGDPEPAAAPTS